MPKTIHEMTIEEKRQLDKGCGGDEIGMESWQRDSGGQKVERPMLKAERPNKCWKLSLLIMIMIIKDVGVKL